MSPVAPKRVKATTDEPFTSSYLELVGDDQFWGVDVEQYIDHDEYDDGEKNGEVTDERPEHGREQGAVPELLQGYRQTERSQEEQDGQEEDVRDVGGHVTAVTDGIARPFVAHWSVKGVPLEGRGQRGDVVTDCGQVTGD